MPLNPTTIKKRSAPVRTVRIDSRHRIPLPPEIDWKAGTRVYFFVASGARRFGRATGNACGLVISIKPGPVWQGRLVSARIGRAIFVPLTKVRQRFVGAGREHRATRRREVA
jgi:hypothetical protein